MHLRAVTLRGFKSFAERTHVELDPGLIAVVGPNGAGKSNLVDALIWALGTLSVRALRAERMEDVIFTGTTERKPLGMAQVVLTFDNASGAFPVDFSEVEVGRTLFRDGASDYSLNGASCRLLDVQELLAEAGIGRELHAVVAQGEVDDIVSSKPEELRAHVEEAAGISKHRRRKERALRKIERVEQDVSRVADLLRELRRQLKPLRAQAEQAVRHNEITERLRELRLRLAVGELVELGEQRCRAQAARETTEEGRTALRERIEGLRGEKASRERELDGARGEAATLRGSLDGLRSAQTSAMRAVVVLRERARATPDERRREAVAAKLSELDASEREVRTALERVTGEVRVREERLEGLRSAAREVAEELSAAIAERDRVADELRDVDAESRSVEKEAIGARAEASGAGERADRAGERIERISQQAGDVRQQIERLDSDAGRASLTVQRLTTEHREANEKLQEADGKLRAISSEAAVLAGRMESLRMARDLAAARRRGAEQLRSEHGVELGVRGILSDVLRVPSGLERAVEAALGPALDALVVGGANLAEAIVRAEEDEADVLVAPTLPGSGSAEVIPGARRIVDVVEAPGFLRGTVDALIGRTYLVDSWEDAVRLAAEHPDAAFVTETGRVLAGRGLSRPAPAASNGTLGITAALERTEEAVRRVEAERGRWTTNLDRRRRDVERLSGELEEARSALNEVEGRIAAAADRLRELDASEHAATLERDLAVRDRDARLRKAEEALSRKAQLEAREAALAERSAELARTIEGLGQRDADASDGIRELEAELSGLLQERAQLTERLRGVTETREELRAEERLASEPPTDPADLRSAEEMLAALDRTTERAGERVRELTAREQEAEAALRKVSEELSRAEVEAASLEPRAMQAAEEVARLEARLTEVGTRIAETFEVPPSRAADEFPPPADRTAAEREVARLDAELKRMGPVNPLAAEEISSLTERETFLEGQVEDLRSSKRDLLRLVRATEDRMRAVLTSAVDDADVRFREVVGLLFPEGDGRLRLTGSEDPLEAGLEIEVKLGRKGHRRLAFLSGGEKALAGLGFLFALHLARPTPFLVLDEVDAPLDDANLSRFLRLLDALRQKTQVVVITHQKRTMERADTLVGVTLNPDGTSRVVTQDLRQHAELPSS